MGDNGEGRKRPDARLGERDHAAAFAGVTRKDKEAGDMPS
jgi:hypothetical protein